eukprot:8631556-Pyramimonas_sp.AAC.1
MTLQDCWVQVPGAVRRVHVGPRREPFSFAEAESPPVPVSQSGPGRVTYQMLDSESSACSVVESIWVKGAPGEVLSFTGRWIGCAEFPIECSDQDLGEGPQQGTCGRYSSFPFSLGLDSVQPGTGTR